MASNVARKPPENNGDVALAAAPIHVIGLDIHDAAYHLAHDYPGGVPALAQRMGKSANTLNSKVSLNDQIHHLTLREAVVMQEISGDARILHAMAGALGYTCISMRCDASPTTMQQVMNMAQEFGQVLGAVNEAVSDGRVTPREMQDCERQAAELTAAINGVLASVRSLMPKVPA